MFEGDSADMCAGKFPLVSMGGRSNGQACADGERGPPLARVEILKLLLGRLEASLAIIHNSHGYFHIIGSLILFFSKVFVQKTCQVG
jgi:hypothetical protein